MFSQFIESGEFSGIKWSAYERISNVLNLDYVVTSTWSLMVVVIDIPDHIADEVAWMPRGKWVMLVGYEDTIYNTDGSKCEISVGCEIIGKITDDKYVLSKKAIVVPLRKLCPVIYWNMAKLIEKRQKAVDC